MDAMKNTCQIQQINSPPPDNVHINDEGNVNVDEIMNLCTCQKCLSQL